MEKQPSGCHAGEKTHERGTYDAVDAYHPKELLRLLDSVRQGT